MGFFDQPLSKDTDLKYNENVIKNPILYSDSNNPDLYVLLEKPYNKSIINEYVKLIKNEVPEMKIQVLCILSVFVKDTDIKGGIGNFYIENKIDISSFIPPYSKVVADRRSMNALNESDDLEVEGFYDIVFNEPFYYNPFYKITVFPIDPIIYWISRDDKYNKVEVKDTWIKFFSLRQIKKAFSYKVKKKRHRKIELVTVENPNKFLIEKGNEDIDLVAWDIETNSLDPWHPDSHILELTMSFDGITGYYFTWDDIDTKILSDFFYNKKQILHNGKFDVKFLVLNGVERNSLNIYHDTWNGSHVVNEMQRSSLKSDAWIYTDMGGYDNDLEKYKQRYPECKNDYSKIPVSVRKPYAIKDSIATYRLYEAQVQKFNEMTEKTKKNKVWSLDKYFYESVMPTVNMFIDVELEGMMVDWKKVRSHSNELQQGIEDVKKQIWNVFDVPKDFINLSSDPELGTFLEINGWPNVGRGKKKPNKNMVKHLQEYYPDKKIDTTKGVYLTGEEPLSKWRKAGYEKEVDLLLKYRELNTLMKTFVGVEKDNTGMFQYRKVDDRIHSTFGPMLTNSHRNWSKEPNLQNMPKQGGKAKWYRQIFNVPDEDHYIVEFDAAGLQLRIGAILSDDGVMREAFTTGDGDLHGKTAHKIFMNDITEEEFKNRLKNKDKEAKANRFKAKGVNFQLEFGATAFNFAKTVIEPDWSEEDIDEYIKDNKLEKTVIRRLKRLNGEEMPDPDNTPVIGPPINLFKDISDKPHFAKCWAVASRVRDKHFNVYKGLKQWTERVPLETAKKGYVQSSFGAIRRLPELLYQGSMDHPAHAKNLKNISLNSPVQNFEVVLMMKVMVAVNNYVKRNNMKSKVIGNVHDSVVMYIHKSEFEAIFNKAKDVFEEDIPENNGIPMLMEFDVSDYYGKNQVWGFGEEIAHKKDLGKFLKEFKEG